MSNITFFSVDPTSILTDMITKFEEASGTKLSQGSPEYCFASMCAYTYVLFLNRLNSLGNNLLLDNSSSPTLDYLASLVGIIRNSASYAACTIQFTLVNGHSTQVIPQGTRISSSDGQAIFDTIEDLTIEEGTNVGTVAAKCEVGGSSYNNYEISSINTLIDALAYVIAVTNLDSPTGGDDAESDSELITRVKSAPAAYSCGGPKTAYEFYAKKVSDQIIDIAIMTFNDKSTIPAGEVWVYALMTGGTQPTQAINDEIASELNGEQIRPITDTVRVKTPAQITYSLVVNIVKTPGAADSLTADITAAIKTYTTAESLKLGADIVKSKIIAACMALNSVYSADVTLTSAGTPEKDQLIINSAANASGNIAIVLNGAQTNVAVIGGTPEIDKLTISGTPTASGDIKLSLNGFETGIPVSGGTQEVDVLTITSPTTSIGTLILDLNGVEHDVDLASGLTTNQVASAIAATSFDGWTVISNKNIVTFTKNAAGVCSAPSKTYTFTDGSAAGTFIVQTAGVNPDTTAAIAAKIATYTFDGWSVQSSGSNVTFTNSENGICVIPSFDANSTGVSASFAQSQVGVNGDTPTSIATKITATPFTGWAPTASGNVVTFLRSTVDICTDPSFIANSTGVTGSFQRIQQGYSLIADGNLELDNSQVSKLDGLAINIVGTNE